ncbi:MAG TPA: hypothetical protein VMG12_09770 [Polyangiaceae bacterium]|nr:hypothetical protein [Polyangiaceae bacterium]
MPVELPDDVAERAREVQRNLERARDEAREFDREFSSDGAGYVKLIIVLQLVGVGVALGLWFDILERTGLAPTGYQAMLVLCSFLGPLLFWSIAEHRRLDRDLRDYAKRAFAKLEVQPHTINQQLKLSCSGCGGVLDSTKVRGLSITCSHCQNDMLAPACLVDEGQQRFLQKVLALRARLQRKTYTREIILCVAGLAYVVTFGWSWKAIEGAPDFATQWVFAMFFYSFSLALFWFVTHTSDGWDFVGAASAVIAFPLVALMTFAYVYLEVLGVKTFLH